MTLHHPPSPESTREFAKQVAGHFILHRPQKQKEGGSTAHTVEDNADKNNELPVTNMVTDKNNADNIEPPVTSTVTDNVLDIVSTMDWSKGFSVVDSQQISTWCQVQMEYILSIK